MHVIPNLFIVGAPKCGTTSLHYYLNQHPDIFLCEPKEPNFFNTDIKRSSRISKEEYFSLFEEAKEKYIGEATPLYLMSKEAPINIKKISPDAKIIIAIRRPADLIFSAFHQNKYNLVEEATTLEEALAEEQERAKNLKHTKTGEPVDRLIYSRFVDFSTQIQHYIKAFGQDQVHVIIFDELKLNTKKEVLKVFDFLGVRKDVPINYSIQNAAKAHKNYVVASILKSPPALISKIGRFLFSPETRRKLYLLIKNVNTDDAKKPKLNPQTDKLLTERYKPEIEKLESLLNRDLSGWKISKP